MLLLLLRFRLLFASTSFIGCLGLCSLPDFPVFASCCLHFICTVALGLYSFPVCVHHRFRLFFFCPGPSFSCDRLKLLYYCLRSFIAVYSSTHCLFPSQFVFSPLTSATSNSVGSTRLPFFASVCVCVCVGYAHTSALLGSTTVVVRFDFTSSRLTAPTSGFACSGFTSSTEILMVSLFNSDRLSELKMVKNRSSRPGRMDGDYV